MTFVDLSVFGSDSHFIDLQCIDHFLIVSTVCLKTKHFVFLMTRIHHRPESSGPDPGPGSSCVSFRSDWSKEYPPDFSKET